MKKILLLVVVTILFSSCSATKRNALSTPAYAPSAEINPLRANVSVDMEKKLKGESTSTYFLFFRTSGDNKFAEGLSYSGNSLNNTLRRREAKAKSSAAFKALGNSDADIIVHPNYVVETKNYLFFKKIHVTVTGYAGYFDKFYQKEYCNECNEDVQLNIDLKSKK